MDHIQKTVTLPSGAKVTFVHRDVMKRNRPKRNRARLSTTGPYLVALPIDCTGDATVVCPMDGNDSYGDCGPVMCAHVNGVRTYGQGKPGFLELQATQALLISQYLAVSGGDNGTTEQMLAGDQGVGHGGAPGPGIWLTGIAGDPTATIVDHLDIEPGDVATRRPRLPRLHGVVCPR
jgi:hypothetical protein